jgi:hypothetical protein
MLEPVPASYHPNKKMKTLAYGIKPAHLEPVPTSSTDMNCAEKKPCHVMRVKLPTPNNKGLELNGNNGKYPKTLALLASSGMSGSDEKKERRVIKIKMPTALRQNKKEKKNIRKMVV